MYGKDLYIFFGWDFVAETENGIEDIWAICEGTNYPRFVWQIPVGDLVCPDGVAMPDLALLATHWPDDNCDPGNDYCKGTDLDLSGAVDIGCWLVMWLICCVILTAIWVEFDIKIVKIESYTDS